MPILLHSNGRKKYVLRRISTGEIINRGVFYPNAEDDAPIIGLDPDLEYLAMDQDVRPDYDARVFSLVTNEDRQEGTPPLWRITFDTVRRPTTEIKAAAQNVEAVKNRLHYSEQERDKLCILGLAVLFRQIANQQLTQKEVNLKQRILAMGATIWKNDDRLRAIFTALDANQTPDLDAEWEPAPSNP
jgi:hypothetical protein